MSKLMNKLMNKNSSSPSVGTGKSDYNTVTGDDTQGMEGDRVGTGYGHQAGSAATTTGSNSSYTAADGMAGDSVTGTDDFDGSNGTGTQNLGHRHTFGHKHDAASTNIDGTANVHHDVKHLSEKVHENVLHKEIEEVERQREQERHIHHVQHHVQPVIDREVLEEQQHERAVPVTHIHEKHVNQDADREAYASLGREHQDTLTHAPKERTVLDRGEVVNETVHHHVHNIVQPIIEKETVDRHRIHTSIPVQHVIHEAPIIHGSVAHEPVAKDAFLSQGGQLGSGITHENAGVLENGDCERVVDGPGETLVQELGLSSGTTGTTNGQRV